MTFMDIYGCRIKYEIIYQKEYIKSMFLKQIVKKDICHKQLFLMYNDNIVIVNQF